MAFDDMYPYVLQPPSLLCNQAVDIRVIIDDHEEVYDMLVCISRLGENNQLIHTVTWTICLFAQKKVQKTIGAIEADFAALAPMSEGQSRESIETAPTSRVDRRELRRAGRVDTS